MSCSCKLFAVHLLFDVITEQINDDDDDDEVNQVNSAFHPSAVGKSSTGLHGWG